MERKLKKFLEEEASRPLSLEQPRLSDHILELAGPLASDYLEMLKAKNGFYAFYGALHVYSSGQAGIDGEEKSLEEWNDPALWIDRYNGDADGALYFAQDVEGNQFAIKDGRIQSFELFDADFTPFADSFGEWAKKLTANPEKELGSSIVQLFMHEGKFMARGERLFAPLSWAKEHSEKGVMYGNVPMLECVHAGAKVWDMIKDVPEGQKILITVVDE